MNVIQRLDPVKLGERLRIARSNSNLTQEEAATRLKVARTTIVAIEQGQRRIRESELRELSDLYGTGINDLLRETSVILDMAAKFRKAETASKYPVECDKAVRLLNKLASASAEIEERLGCRTMFYYPPEKRIQPGNLETQAEDLALQVRHRLGLGLAPIANIFSLLELELGIRVFLRPVHSSISGLFVFDPQVGPCMLINSSHSWERQIQTASHETGHFFVTRSSADVWEGNSQDDSKEERFVTLFGLCFLMPAAAIRGRFEDVCAVNNQFSPRQLILMAHSFNVSVEALCRRLEGLGLLPSGTYDSLKDRGFAIENAKKAIGITGAPPIAIPPRIILLAAEAERASLFSEGQLCEMLELDRIELRKYLDLLGNAGLDDELTVKT